MHTRIKTQCGASLVMGLLILLAITLLTLVTARASLSQNQALQAGLELQLTFAAADSALTAAELELFQQLQLQPCTGTCEEINGILTVTDINTELSRTDDQWWQATATAWLGGWRLTIIQSSELIVIYEESSGVWTEFQREIYSSYLYQPGLLSGNRVLLHSLWLVDRPMDGAPLPEPCLNTSAARRAWQENTLGICGRLAWEQLLP